MDDAEAEAVLLELMALPPQLRWTERSPYVYVSQEVAPDHSYTIITEPGGDGRFISRLARGRGPVWNPVFASTLEKAKAACERHYATGKWKLETASPSTVFQLAEAKTKADEKAKAEAEAEAVAEVQAYAEAMLPLRKLPLLWKDSPVGPSGRCIAGEEAPQFFYWVRPATGGGFIPSRHGDLGSESNSKAYQTEDEAKAACEHHHATGNW